MSTPIFEFTSDVAEEGYRWVDAKHLHGVFFERVHSPDGAPHRVLIPSEESPLPRSRRYAPLQEQTGLFRILAETELSEEAVLRFANHFGLLGMRPTVYDPTVETGDRSVLQF